MCYGEVIEAVGIYLSVDESNAFALASILEYGMIEYEYVEGRKVPWSVRDQLSRAIEGIRAWAVERAKQRVTEGET